MLNCLKMCFLNQISCNQNPKYILEAFINCLISHRSLNTWGALTLQNSHFLQFVVINLSEFGIF